MVVRWNTVIGGVELWLRLQTRSLCQISNFPPPSETWLNNPSPPPECFGWPLCFVNQKTPTLTHLVLHFPLDRAEKQRKATSFIIYADFFFFLKKMWRYHGVIMGVEGVWHKLQINTLPPWLSLEVSVQQLHILQSQFMYSFTQLNLSRKRNQMCFLPVPSFPWKQLGFIELAPKAWMVETAHSISLLNLW